MSYMSQQVYITRLYSVLQFVLLQDTHHYGLIYSCYFPRRLMCSLKVVLFYLCFLKLTLL